MRKTCKRCQMTKDGSDFYKDKRASTGLTANCRTCTQAMNKERANSVSPPSEKTCTQCDETKPIHLFTRNNHRRDGRESKCRECRYTVARAYQVERYYGLTPTEFEALLAGQDGKCAICHRPPKTRALSVDHCHDKGHVRGLLCWPCNRFLGHINDRTDILDNMISYLTGPVAQ